MQGKNKVIFRYLQNTLQRLLRKRQSCLILGPRQVGKTTLVRAILHGYPKIVEYLLQNPATRQDLEVDPSRLLREIQAHASPPLVFVDEAQKVPEMFDAAQLLLDNRQAQFIFTGSSARKLRRKGANLLPGRIQRLVLDPLTWGEFGWIKKGTITPLAISNLRNQLRFSFEESLIYGSLPGIVLLPEDDRAAFLKSYSEIYLEEEIRAEALSRKIGAFSRFLELAAIESGTNPNFTKLSNESGVSQPAIKSYYGILEDTLVVEKLEPFLKNARKRILTSPRYYFFDLGVRNALARLPLDRKMINAQKGILFEHAVVLECIRRARILNNNARFYFWRTGGGAEVDLVIDLGATVIPIEIKSSRQVSNIELKGLKNFLKEYAPLAPMGFVVTMGQRKERLAENIVAVPWFEI